MSSLTFRHIGPKIKTLKSHTWQRRAGVPPHFVHLSGFNDGAKRGPTAETLRLWMRGLKSPKFETIDEMCQVINEKFELSAPLCAAHLADQTPFEAFLDAIGQTDDVRRLENEFTTWSQDSRLCSTFTFRPAHRSVFSLVHHLPGLYLVHRVRLDATHPESDLLPMAILSTVRASHRRNESEVFIPCVMSIRARKSETLFRYKGVVGPLENGIEWRFFQEGTQNLDRIVIMSKRMDMREGHELKGHMVTMTQGPEYQSMAAAVSIERVRDLPSLEEIGEFLETARVVHPADIDSDTNVKHPVLVGS